MLTPAAVQGDDFPISDAEFRAFGEFFYAKSGVQFAASKRYFVDRKLAERARARTCATFREYFTLLRADRAQTELQELINLLTVNETYFFRETYQFAALVGSALPQIAKRKRPGDVIRIWSLPCSTGEEPYSIAIAVLDSWPQADQFAVEILASDIDTRVLAEAKAGVYGERSLQNVSAQLRQRYFRRVADGAQIIPELRGSIDFSRVNLTDANDMAQRRNVDVIFCRNVLIYFDDVSRRLAVEAIFASLAPGGFLFLGHSENLNRMPSLFVPRRLNDCIVYQRPLEKR
jgi:chemotaxis protein methyltransferase CheR